MAAEQQIVWVPDGDVDAVQSIVRLMRDAGAEIHPLWAEFRVYTFWGASTVVLWEGDTPISINSTKIGKRKKNIWEPYANWYAAYTLPDWRHRGYATRLFREVEDRAQTAGCRRVKSLAASRAGLGLHHHLGHTAWGLTDKREVIVDAPLALYEDFYADKGPPPQVPLGSPMSKALIKSIMKGGLRYDKAKA